MRTPTRIAFFLSGSLLLLSCGIPRIPYLNPPTVLGAPVGSDQFQFQSTSDNSEPEFRGFELYYKLYDPAVFAEKNLTDKTELEAAGFRRVRASGDRVGNETRPLVPVDILDRGTLFTVTVDFSEAELQAHNTNYPLAEAPTPVVPIRVADLRRGVTYAFPLDNEFKTFVQYASTDQDLPAGVYSDVSLNVNLDLYAMSYGLSGGVEDVYSQAVWLGEISISFPNFP